MKGVIKGSSEIEVSITATGMLLIQVSSDQQSILINPYQAQALVEFIKDADEEMSKAYVGAQWGN